MPTIIDAAIIMINILIATIIFYSSFFILFCLMG